MARPASGFSPPATVLLTLLLIPSLLSCSSSISTTEGVTPEGRIEHVVLCWLKNPASEEDRQRLIETGAQLTEIPGVLSVTAGGAVPSDRPVVDDSFDVGFVILLEDAAALNGYLSHPIHLAAVRDVLAPLVERTVIYDIGVE